MNSQVQPVTPSLQADLVASVRKSLGRKKTFTARLKNALKKIAIGLDAEVAILYLLNEDMHLEICASYDQNGGPRRYSRFKVGEGVVGSIASTGDPISTPNVTTHPSFIYRPGIENHTHLALVGVPIKADHGIVGVLVLQNPLVHPFEPWHLEVLVDLAQEISLLSEFKLLPCVPASPNFQKEAHVFKGIGICAGVAVGTAYIHKPKVWKEAQAAKDVRFERERLKMAVRQMIASLQELIDSETFVEESASREVMESYLMIAQDRGWIRRIQETINRGLTAEAAVQKIRRQTRERYAQMGDRYLKARLSDFEDLANRLMRYLSNDESDLDTLTEPTILVAYHLGPAELLDYDRRYIKGLILEEASLSTHVAIVARALDIPVIGRIPNTLALIKDGMHLIIDGGAGTISLNPTPDQIGVARKTITQQKQWQESAKELRPIPTQTLDGTPIKLRLNAGVALDLEQIDLLGAEGVGLYRTEIPFMMRSSFPGLQVQTDLYTDIIDRAGKHSIAFRTLDIGGDKVVPYMWKVEDENPAMGWRAIRVSLDKPSLIRQQARALIRASRGKDLKIMFPMVATAEEFFQARAQISDERERLRKNDEIVPLTIEYGAMLEVPSFIWELDYLIGHVDFIAVGSNDLSQFFFACDRGNPLMTGRYDVLSSSFIQLLSRVQSKCELADIPVSVCGQMASNPIEAMALIGLGFTELSVTPQAFVSIKKMLTHLNRQKLERGLIENIHKGLHNVREYLTEFAKSEGIPL